MHPAPTDWLSAQCPARNRLAGIFARLLTQRIVPAEASLGVTTAILSSVFPSYLFPTPASHFHHTGPLHERFGAQEKDRERRRPDRRRFCSEFSARLPSLHKTAQLHLRSTLFRCSRASKRPYRHLHLDVTTDSFLTIHHPASRILAARNQARTAHPPSLTSYFANSPAQYTIDTMAEAPLTPFGQALAGALGGVFSNAVIYPLDTVKTRIQAGQSSAVTPGKEVRDPKDPTKTIVTVPKNVGMIKGILHIIHSKEGAMGLYKGFAASMVNTFTTGFAYFYWYSTVRTLYQNRLAKRSANGVAIMSTAAELVLGAIAGALAQIFTIPVAVIATRQQLATSETAKDGKPVDESFMGVARDILKEDGVTGLWRGLKPSLVLTVNPAITYGVFERVKTIILATSVDGKMTPGKSFLVGALSKTLATVVTFPYILSKIRLQAKNTRYTSAIDCLTQIAKEQGISGWYQGMQAQITKAVLAQALLFYFRDYFEVWTRQILKVAKKPVK
ncbi:hypothetical protein PaG_04836 [Moesziomyces aphidis]|uniref:Mitochondrial carrier protein n=1 Tax=Moesziomyces aphidis TaxID=84754 RepID=W3VHB8_MOEAP|nr:hypothetical protein PaG_04836 [Moesziomyces aphidis]